MPLRHTALLAALTATAALGVAGPAHAVLLKGTVAGAPYVAGKDTTAVPVIFSKQTAKRAGLQSPVGVMVIPRRKSVRSHQGKVAPSKLRLGDRFRFRARVSEEAKRAVYTRLATRKLYVYKRSKTLSTAELETLVRQMQRQLTALERYVGGLTRYTVANIESLRADLNALRADVEALRSAIRSLEGATAELKAQLDKLAADLAKAIADLAALTKTVASLQAAVGDLQAVLLGSVNSLTGKTLATVSDALTDLTSIQTTLTTVKSATDYVETTGKTSISSLSTALYGNDGSDGTTDIQAKLTTLAGYLYGAGTPSAPDAGTVLHTLCSTTTGLIKEYNDLRSGLVSSLHNQRIGVVDLSLLVIGSTTPDLSGVAAVPACAA